MHEHLGTLGPHPYGAEPTVHGKLEGLGLAQGAGDSARPSAQGSAGNAQGSDVVAILTERGARYGKFIDHSGVAQRLKTVMRNHMGDRWDVMSDDQKEALEMIAHKLARIANGSADYIDGWRDIAGYATLVMQRLLETDGATDAKVNPMIRANGHWVEEKR